MSQKLSQYAARGYKSVEGWLLPGAVRMIVSVAEAQTIPGHVAEIGIHHGKLFILLYLLSKPGEKALAIDLFEDQQRNIDQSGGGDRSRFLVNLRRYADDQNLIVHQGDSTEMSATDLIRLAGGPFRMISIDGGHTAEITAHDLETSEGALAHGGIAILDDYFNESWPGVSDGANLYFRKPRGIVPFAIGGNKTFFCHPEFSQHYAEVAMTGATSVDHHKLLGSPVLCGNFSPLSLVQKIGRIPAWKAVKDIPPIKIARHGYRTLKALLR